MSFWNWIPAKQAMPLSLEAHKKAIELDDQIAESLINLGRKRFHYNWNVRDARIALKKAIAINPNGAETYVQLGMCSVLSGNRDDVIAYSKKAIGLDPFSTMNLWMAIIIPIITGDSFITLMNAERLIDLNSDFLGGHLFAGMAYLQLGKYEEALK